MRCKYALLWLLIFSTAIHAAEDVCYEYRVSIGWTDPPSYASGPSAGSACSAWASADEARATTNYSYSTSMTAGAVDGSGNFTCTGTREVTYTGSGGCEANPWACGSVPLTADGSRVEIPCEDPPDCDPNDPLVQATAGQKFTAGSWQEVSAYAQDFCNPVTNCKTKVNQFAGSGGETVWVMEHTADQCSEGAQPGPTTEQEQEGESCVDIGDGEFCANKAGNGQCGYLNDQYICLAKTPNGGCQKLADGSKVCSGADTPPAPDNGSPGIAATPDGTIQGGTGGPETSTYNYYNSTTVTNSSRDGTDNPDVEGPPGDEDGDGNGDGEGEGECVPGEECAGDLPAIGGDGDCTFAECVSAFLAAVEAAPIVASVSGVGASFPTGSCPTWNLEAFGETYSLSAPMCSIWEDIAPFLSAVFLVIWGWVATRIVLSA